MIMRRMRIGFVLVLLLLACRAVPAGGEKAAPSASAAAGSELPAAEPAASTAAPADPATQPDPTHTPGPVDGSPSADYDMGQPTFTDLFISPTGSDNKDGRTAASALKTLTAAWNLIPNQKPLEGSGWRINLLPGEYACEPAEPDNCQNYFGARWGTRAFPILVRAAQGPGTVTLRGGLNLYDVAYLYLVDLTLAGGSPLPTNSSGNNLLHLAQAEHVLLRGLTLRGPDCANDSCNNLQENLKVNQARYLYVENSTIRGAWHSTVDYFSVQSGHFLNNHVQTAGQWCMYVKGGSAFLRVEGNDFGPCQLGFQAGQSSNLAVMRAPWMQYEAYGIQVVNNVFHDLPGVPLSVSGGGNVLMAYNTLYRVATSTDPGYPLVQLVQGERGCTPTDELPDAQSACRSLVQQGAWGPTFVTDNQPTIPNRSIFVFNNLFLNPAPARTLYAHFYVAAPIRQPAQFEHLPDPIPADENAIFAGNLVWNGPADLPLGTDESTGCGPASPTCSPALIAAGNTINQVEPQLADPAGGDFHPRPGSLPSITTREIPAFSWEGIDATLLQPLQNPGLSDRDGMPRSAGDLPGAYVRR